MPKIKVNLVLALRPRIHAIVPESQQLLIGRRTSHPLQIQDQSVQARKKQFSVSTGSMGVRLQFASTVMYSYRVY